MLNFVILAIILRKMIIFAPQIYAFLCLKQNICSNYWGFYIYLTIKRSIYCIMLNQELIERLYQELPPKRQKELCVLLFKKSKQTMAYFQRNNITLEKLETLADFYGMPLDYFRLESKSKANNVVGNSNYVGNVSYGDSLIKENESLRKEIENLKAMIEAKNETIMAKNEVIETLKSKFAQDNKEAKQEAETVKES
jgi:hypothetical protein